MNSTVESLWEDVLSALRPRMNDESYDLWFRPIRARSLESNRLILQVPNPFFSDWLRDHYQDTIEQLLRERSGQPLSLAFQVLRPVEELIKSGPAIPQQRLLPRPAAPELPPM